MEKVSGNNMEDLDESFGFLDYQNKTNIIKNDPVTELRKLKKYFSYRQLANVIGLNHNMLCEIVTERYAPELKESTLKKIDEGINNLKKQIIYECK